MVSAFTHGYSALAIGVLFPQSVLPRGTWITGALLAAAPDLDAVLHWSGVPYQHLCGHRGLSHSPFFAAVVVGGIVLWTRRRQPRPEARRSWARLAYLWLCMASHGVLDAMTNGGLGIAFLAPFSDARFFLPWNPIEVAPISVSGFFTAHGWRVFQSELFWVWIPCTVVIALQWGIRAVRRRAAPAVTP